MILFNISKTKPKYTILFKEANFSWKGIKKRSVLSKKAIKTDKVHGSEDREQSTGHKWAEG